MKNLVRITFVFAALSFALTSCENNDPDPIVYFWDEPAVVEPSNIIRTAYGKFQVPALDSTVTEGSVLWTAFAVNSNDKTTDETLAGQAYNFKYEKVDTSQVILPTTAEEFEAYRADDYSDSIKVAGLFPTYVDEILFFGFTHETLQSGDAYAYELVLNPDIEDENGFPTLYIRAKKLLKTRTAASTPRIIYGFDMKAWVSGTVQFNLKYKIGTNAAGEDVYRAFQSNPIEWKIPEKK